MKALRILIVPFLTLFLFSCKSADTVKEPQGIFANYNDILYPDVITAAKGIGLPFLLQQGYYTLPGVQVHDTVLLLMGTQDSFLTYEHYINPPDSADGQFYFIDSSSYASFGIGNFAAVWPHRIPNAFYNSSSNIFNATLDCVGYGSRVLSAVGDTSESGNAYRHLMQMIHSAGNITFAGKGAVASAYQFAVAFPTIPATSSSWHYISGNVAIDSVNYYDTLKDHTAPLYIGKPKGGFDQATVGDILSFGYDPRAKDNGHFMVIARPPSLLNYDSLHTRYLPTKATDTVQNLVNMYHVYAVDVFDCSGDTTHFFDSRITRSGIGHGTLLLLTEPKNETPMAFIFGPSFQSQPALIKQGQVGVSTFAISVGRWQPPMGRKK